MPSGARPRISAGGDLEAGKTCAKAEVVVSRRDRGFGPHSFTGISSYGFSRRFRYGRRPFRKEPRDPWFQRSVTGRSSSRSMPVDCLWRLAGHVLRRAGFKFLVMVRTPLQARLQAARSSRDFQEIPVEDLA
jgi:hypothetical protein